MGRPTLYSPDVVEEICARLESGEPLEEICRDEKMPSSRAVNDWQNGVVSSVPKSVSAAIARAREIGYDTIANKTRSVARGLEGSTGDVARDKLIIETDLKLLAKWMPKRYGDSTTIRGDKDNPIEFTLAAKLDNAMNRLPGKIVEMIDVTNSKEDASDVTNGSEKSNDNI